MSKPKIGRALGWAMPAHAIRPVIVNGQRWGSGTYVVNGGPDDRRRHRRNYAVFMGSLAKRKREAEAERWFKERFGKATK